MLLAVAALVAAARRLHNSSFGVGRAIALGALLGAGQLVRAFSLWTFAVVALGVRRGFYGRVLGGLL